MNVKQKKCFYTPADDFVNDRVKNHNSTRHLKPSDGTPLYLPTSPSRTLFFSHTLPPLQYFLTALKGHFADIWGFCVEVLRLHTSLSFGITTEKQHSHLHEKSNMGKRRGGERGRGGSEGWLSFMREREPGENRQQCCYLHTQTTLISAHPVIKVCGYKAQLKTICGLIAVRSHWVQCLMKTPRDIIPDIILG